MRMSNKMDKPDVAGNRRKARGMRKAIAAQFSGVLAMDSFDNGVLLKP